MRICVPVYYGACTLYVNSTVSLFVNSLLCIVTDLNLRAGA